MTEPDLLRQLNASERATELLPELLETLHSDETWQGSRDQWTCRECSIETTLVVVVPYKGAYKHAVHPLCSDHYPSAALTDAICTSRWPGPATPPRYARIKRAQDALDDALENVEGAARELDAFFDGDPDGWRLGGRLILNVDVSNALLSLHDYLNDARNARDALSGEALGA